MSAIRYCPACEGIVNVGDERCVMCGTDLRVDQPFVEPPSYYRDQAQLAAQREAAEPSKALGIMAWLAQGLATLWVILFCVLPALIVLVAVIFVLIASATR